MNDHNSRPARSRISKSALKRDMLELQRLGERLTKLSQAQLSRIHLPDVLHTAVLQARNIKSRGGHRRQLQYIGKLMRDIDVSDIRAAFAKLDSSARQAGAVLHEAEYWRDRLIREGEGSLAELVTRFPQADRQHLQYLSKAARQDVATQVAPRHARELFRYLHQIIKAARGQDF